jgi:LysM repeat protein
MNMNTRHTNPHSRIVIVALMLAAVACNLGGSEKKRNPTPQPIPSVTFMPPTPTFVVDTATPYLTPTPTPTPVTPTAIPCVPLVSWTTFYAVQEGDTLYQIALATGTTVEQLVIANCLQNANVIAAGQLLRVPRLPVQPEPTITPTPFATVDVLAPRLSSPLEADPYWIDPQTGQPTTYYPTVRVELDEVYNALQVDFYINDLPSGSAAHIGSDFDPWDGAFVDYEFPPYNPSVTNSYTFVAFVKNDKVSIQSNVFTIVYDPYFVPPEGRYNVLTITPHRAFDGTNYTLVIGNTVTIQWENAPLNALQVDFYMQPYAAAGQQTPRLIGSDHDLADGTWITWRVPAGLYGYIFGRATLPDGTHVESQNMSVISAE